MNKIKVNVRPIEQDETFVLILPSRQSYEIGAMYLIIDFFSDEMICYKALAFKETMPLSQLTDFHTFLAKNCHKQLFESIIKNQYKTRLTDENYAALPNLLKLQYKVGDLFTYINSDTLVDVLLFTNNSNLKSYKERVKNAPRMIEASGQSLLSKKPVISKNYCHKTYWNFEAQRPYTKEELQQLQIENHG